MDSVFFIVVFFILVAMILKYGFRVDDQDINNRHRPNKKTKPVQQDFNDKIVLVKYMQFEYLVQAIHQFCNLYNQDQFIAMPRLTNQYYLFIITFPYNIDFEKFCFFVNYLGNADGLRNKDDYQPNVKAWCTAKSVDTGMTGLILNKKVMLSIPENEAKKDNMYLTTNENVGYTMNISQVGSHIKLEKTPMAYEKIPVNITDFANKKYIDFN